MVRLLVTYLMKQFFLWKFVLYYLFNLSSLFNSNYFQPQVLTSSLVYDFTVINFEIGYITPVFIIFKLTPSTIINQEIMVNSIKINLYSSSLDTFRLVCEIIFVLSLLLYIYLLITNIITNIKC